MRITIDRIAAGLPILAQDGDTVSFSLPAGFVLRKIVGGVTSTVTDPSPITHQGGEAVYRIDRISTDGQPAQAELNIE